MTFRKDIEILRGFSVLLVLLYHFKFDLLESNFTNSGYIGVDIFFVISGYIITKIFFENLIAIFEIDSDLDPIAVSLLTVFATLNDI